MSATKLPIAVGRNTTFPSIRPLRSRRNRLSGIFFIACALAAAIATKARAEYAFTLIADSTGVFSDFGKRQKQKRGQEIMALS